MKYLLEHCSLGFSQYILGVGVGGQPLQPSLTDTEKILLGS